MYILLCDAVGKRIWAIFPMFGVFGTKTKSSASFNVLYPGNMEVMTFKIGTCKPRGLNEIHQNFLQET